MKPTNPIIKRITLAAASLSSIFLPVAPASGYRRDDNTEVIPNGDGIIVDDGCEVTSLKGGIARHIELEEATMRATASCNPFGTTWGEVKKVGVSPEGFRPNAKVWENRPGISPDIDTETPLLTHTKDGGLNS